MACSVESVPVTNWNLLMTIEYNEKNDAFPYIKGHSFSSREAAEFALVSAKRIMEACGFNVDFNLVQENPYAEEFIQNKKNM